MLAACRKYFDAEKGTAFAILHEAYTRLLKVPSDHVTEPAPGTTPGEEPATKIAMDAAESATSNATGVDEGMSWLKVGAMVLTSFGNQKEKFDGFKGQVTKVLSKKVFVKMLEGDATGTVKDFDKAKLSRWEDGVVPAAGCLPDPSSKKRTAASAGLDEMSAPLDGSALADSIFGKVPGAPSAP